MQAPDVVEMVRNVISGLKREEAAEKFNVSVGTIQNWANAKAGPSAEAIQIVLNDYYDQKHELTIWEGRKVFLLLPVYRQYEPAMIFSLLRNYAQYGAEKIGMFYQEKTLISDARNILVDKFLKTNGEWAIFIDSDMILPMGDAAMFAKFGAQLPAASQSMLFMDRIMKTDKPIIGALYFSRGPLGKAQYCEAFESVQENQRAHAMINPGVKQTKWVATGAMRIHRSVFEKMREAAPKEFPEIVPAGKDFPWGYFNQITSGIGEDVSFCLRAGRIGINSYVDTGLVCMHVGTQIYGPRKAAI